MINHTGVKESLIRFIGRLAQCLPSMSKVCLFITIWYFSLIILLLCYLDELLSHGFETLSRGASSAIFVDFSRECIETSCRNSLKCASSLIEPDSSLIRNHIGIDMDMLIIVAEELKTLRYNSNYLMSNKWYLGDAPIWWDDHLYCRLFTVFGSWWS